MLFQNEIVPGQKISYRELAERLGMSLTPVIQALKRLEFQNLVRHEPNRGYFTEPVSLEEVQEIYELREVIELSLLPATISMLNETGIKKLKKVLDKNIAASQDFNLNDSLINDREFHLTLASLSGRRIQMDILRRLFDLLYLKYRGSLLFVTAKVPVGSEHKNIFDPVVARDLEKAQQALKSHFTNVKGQVFSALEQIIATTKLTI